ncbi:MAG: DUF4912 domain-containing protein [Nostocales cyanobacterium]|nr:MAG: DUF4912 domain-containing protein [Nostocales cyanobacterium]
MWKQEKSDSVIVHLALSLALVTTPLTANFLASVPTLGESTSKSNLLTFRPPQTVESGTKVRIDCSINLVIINQSLKDNFEKKFPGTQIEIAVNGTDAALKALLDDKIDIAAIARGLTPDEKAQGLEQVRLRREKIAIIVGTNNPFQGSLTDKQFAKIFRGEITDWSELGGQPGKIRFIDRPLTSDTRNSLREYQVFKSGEFSTGANATQIPEDKTTQIIKELGTDGISYVTANQVSKLSNVRVLNIQGIAPDNSKYPFSQPLVYVYKQNPSPGVASFLGFTIAPVGQNAIAAARDAESSAIAASALQNFALETTTGSTPESKPVETPAPLETLPNTVDSRNEQQFVNPVENNPLADRNVIFLMALSLLPIVGFGSFLAWRLKKKQSLTDETKKSLETSLTATTFITETIPKISDEHIIINPIDNPTISNGKTHSHQNITSTISDPEENLTLTEREILVGNSTAIIAPATEKNLDFSTPTIALDCGEVVWDTEAPAAVVNTPYPAVINISEISFNNIELPTDELTTSLLELLNEPIDSSAQNSSISLLEFLDQPKASSTEDAMISLSELLDETADSSTQNSSISLSEALGLPVLPSVQDSTTSLSALLDETSDSSVQDTTTSLSEALDIFPSSVSLDTNTSLSELLGIVPNSADIEFSNSRLQPPSISTANSDQESTISLSELLALTPEEQELDVELVTDEAQKSLSELSEELGRVFNTLADDAELAADLTPELSLNLPISSHFPEAKINYAALEIDPETENIDSTDSTENSLLQSQAPDQTTEVPSFLDISGDSSIVFTPRTPKWAYVSWYVSETQKEAVRKKSNTLLAVRLYDATDIDLSYQSPQLVQQYECEEAICDCYIAIPTSNRDYMTEIGYLTNHNTWLCIARSGTVRIFNRPGANFWFVADTELVIHGSTEPGATVTIGGHKIKLKPDGTFHFRVPFSDSLLNYLMTATTADGEDSITILKKFFQESSEN